MTHPRLRGILQPIRGTVVRLWTVLWDFVNMMMNSRYCKRVTFWPVGQDVGAQIRRACRCVIAFCRWKCALSKPKNRQHFTWPVLRSVQLTSLLEAVWAPGFALFSYRLGTSRYSLALCWSPTSACWKTRNTRGSMYSSSEYANFLGIFLRFFIGSWRS